MSDDASTGPDRLRRVLGARIADSLLNSQNGRDQPEQRFRLLAQVTESLQYRYGALGARWWLEQPTLSLEGWAPIDLLADGDCADACRVSALARSVAA